MKPQKQTPRKSQKPKRNITGFLNRDKERFSIPRSTQQTIPIEAIWRGGVFKVGTAQYSKSYVFTDINFAVASEHEKTAMLEQYGNIINSFELGAMSKITLLARKASHAEYESKLLLPSSEDGLQEYRDELNKVLMEKAAREDNLVLEHYLTITLNKPDAESAEAAFHRIEGILTAAFSRLGSKLSALDAQQRLDILQRFYRGRDEDFHFDFADNQRFARHFKDSIAPDGMEFHADHFCLGEHYGRALFVQDWPTAFSESMLMNLATINRNLCISIDLQPIPTHLAMKEVNKRMMAVEGKIGNWQQKQNQRQNYSAEIPFEMKQQRSEVNEMFEDLSERDQRMISSTITIVHLADNLQALDNDTETLMQIAQNDILRLGTLRYQQMDALNTALPIGVRRTHISRTLITESASYLAPFRVQEIMDRHGLYYGENAISRNLILCDKSQLLNPNSFILGVPGSGKSFAIKMQLLFTALLYSDDDILVCDPEGEYGPLIQELGGEVIKISPSSAHHINAMDMVDGYSDENNPAKEKADFILTLFELIDKRKGVSGKERSIIDRCVRSVYEQSEDSEPTLSTLRDKLLEQPEKEAHDLATVLELFTEGSLNIFAHKTNVNTKNRIVSFDLFDLGEQLRPLGLLVITDALLNRVAENWRKGKRTHIIIDEAHVVFENEHSGEFFLSAWRRFRKRNAFPTAITQNAEYLLDSISGSTMLSNSEFIVMLNQAEKDQQKLGELLGISPEQMQYVDNVEEGCGLIRYGGTLVPFVNKFPKDSPLYTLMDTKPKRK